VVERKTYFCICPEDGNIEWLELYEDDYSKDPRLNYLTPEGKIRYENDMPSKRGYDDIICNLCEAPSVVIPLSLVSVEERKKVYAMSKEERIIFAKKYLIVKKLS